MTEKIIIAGSGGQGIMLLGKLLALAAMKEDKFVTWFPSYGAEVRGGAAYCMVVISDKEIASPLIDVADTLIAMNEPSLEKFKAKLRGNGLLLANISLIHNPISAKTKHIVKGHFSDIALQLGTIRIANTVALGAYIARKNLVSAKTIVKAMEDIAPAGKKDLVAINKKALAEGMNLGARQ